MDREVAAGWFDFMMLDTEHQFANYEHNIPRETFGTNVGTSYIEDSSNSGWDIVDDSQMLLSRYSIQDVSENSV